MTDIEYYNQLSQLVTYVLLMLHIPVVYSFYQIYRRKKVAKSSFISSLLLLLTFCLMCIYQLLLETLFELYEQINHVAISLWYVGFTVFNVGLLFALVTIHQRENLKVSSLGKVIGMNTLLMIFLQMLQYGEIIIFNTDDKIGVIYRYAVPLINFSTFIAIIGTLVAVIYHLQKYGIQLKGVTKWSY